MRYRRPVTLLFGVLVALGLVLGLGHAGWQRATSQYLGELQDRGRNTLGLAVSSLSGQLARFERLPTLIADQRIIRSLLLSPRNTDLVMAANQYLKDTAQTLGASDIYVMYRDGETLAASNFDQSLSFVGGNFAFRPYFFDAMARGAGRFYALGTTSNKRGYYFGAPIDIAGQRYGVMVIKIDLDEIERAWSSEEVRIIVTDPENIVFLSNQPDWLFRSLGPVTPENMSRTQSTRRYANVPITQIDATRTSDVEGRTLLTVPGDEGLRREYLVVATPMPDADWTVQVLLPTRAVRLQAASSVALAGLGLGLLTLIGLVLWQRRRQLAERLAVQQAAKAELESRVIERTSQLAEANAALRAEVTERRNTEDRLRQTQSELVQAGKLAALGQMSAVLSHEFNQPLAAARNYAETAQLYLDRGRLEEARSNVGHILGMVDRMTRISKHLRNFARKPHDKLRTVVLGDVVADAQELMGWRLEKTGVTLSVDLGPEPLRISAGAVRLQQVLVNLMSNAMDAVEDRDDKRLELVARRIGDIVELRLRDHGPGVPEALQPRIFDPFFSTKEVGKGLGLGLSISFNIIRDFGGRLLVRNHPEGGAEFIVELQPAGSDTAGIAA
jgi:two-component system, NtrC family, C4-dicarboxylate transport sensor histidine kinase DctB